MTRYEIEVRERRPMPLEDSEVMSLTEAAKRLGVSIKTMTGLLDRGRLRRVIDTQEPNPQRAARVLRIDVDTELKRRKGSDDARLAAKQTKR